MKAEPNQLNRAISAIMDRAEQNKEAAGYNGAYHDGGYGRTMRDIDFYRHGQSGTVPKDWLKDYKEAEKMADPEWAEYQRLRAKFENG